MPRRTEPETNDNRQRFLAGRRPVRPDVEAGIYPFRDDTDSITLTRADVEWLLDTVSGYGYRPMRSLLAYVTIVLAFAALYLLNGQFGSTHLRWDGAIVLGVSSFHGRGFFATGVSLSDTWRE